MKQIVVHQESCTECREREMACSSEHEGAFVPALSRIRVNELIRSSGAGSATEPR